MIFFIDLDRTIFNTHAFINDLVRHAVKNELFNNAEFPHYVYEDALRFIQTHKEAGDTLVLVTRGDPEVQKAKARYLGILEYFDETCFVSSGPKAAPIAEFMNERANERAFFIDDTVFELTDVKKTVPSVEVVRMRRPDAKNFHEETPELRSISSFDDFKSLI